MFPTISVDPAQAESPEQLGTKRKYWFTDEQNRRVLFKAEQRGTGEDWAEKLACELAGRLGLPHVHYDLAEEQGTGTPGVICESCVPAGWSLVMGNELLLGRDPAYPADDGRKYKVREHTIKAVAEAVGKLQLPPEPWRAVLPAGIGSALDVFLGYVLLDAWVANQDRTPPELGGPVRRLQSLPVPDIRSWGVAGSESERHRTARAANHARCEPTDRGLCPQSTVGVLRHGNGYQAAGHV
jgi:hypothetical protein